MTKRGPASNVAPAIREAERPMNRNISTAVLALAFGVVLAAAILIGLPEIFRELADFRMLAFGAGMVLIMIWRPRGFLAHRDPTVLLHGKKALRDGPRAMAGEGAG